MLPAFLPVRPLLWTAAVAALLGTVTLPSTAQAETALCTVSGTAFADADRDGLHDAGEAPRSGDVLYLFDATGGYVTGATSDSTGAYSFIDLPCGGYTVEYGAQTWWGIRETLVPTTTGSIKPRLTVTGTATADFGWRPIQRSTTAGAPLSSVTGPQGLRVESYNDAVTARELYDAVTAGNIGPEAATVTIRFDLSGSSTTSSSIAATNGVYDRFAALSYVSWLSWLDNGAATLSHEYGHAWAQYRSYLVQQDPSLSGYLAARGLAGDPRVGSSYAWYANEMVAEDYRQLLGGPGAVAPQTNRDIPPASAVAGLRDYLLGPFTGPAPAPTPTVSASPSPSAAASPSPSPSAAASPAVSTSPTPAPSPTATTGRTRPCRKSC